MISLRLLTAIPLVWCGMLWGQSSEEKPSPDAIRVIEAKAVATMRLIKPKGAHGKTLQQMEVENGFIYWGSPFDKDEVIGFTCLQEHPTNDAKFDYPLYALCYFAWKEKESHWQLRQFLGHGSNLACHDRRAGKEHYLQASCRTGRYDGEEHSWCYDNKTRNLIETGLDEAGRFWIAGDYICYPLGRQRRSHDSETTIYQFENGRRGKFLGVFHENDSGWFKVGLPGEGTNQITWWRFSPAEDDEAHWEVFIRPDQSEQAERKAKLVLDQSEELSLDAVYAFELLTGLNQALLEGQWREFLPPSKPLQRIAMTVSGDAEVVKRFMWHPSAKEKARQQAVERAKAAIIAGKARKAVGEIVPNQTITAPLVLRQPDGTACLVGRLFGDDQISAVVLSPDASSDRGESNVSLLLWNGGWMFHQHAGRSPSGTLQLRRSGNVADNYLTIQSEQTALVSTPPWKCDSASHSLIRIESPEVGAYSISGDVLTRSQHGPSSKKTFFRLTEHGPELLAAMNTDGSRQAEITVSRGEGRTEQWRLREVYGGTGTGRSLYTLWMSETSSPTGRDVARIESALTPESCAQVTEYLVKRIAKLTARQYRGEWDDEPLHESDASKQPDIVIKGDDSIVEMLTR